MRLIATRFIVTIVAFVAIIASARTVLAAKSSPESRISVPKGPGSIEGLGRNFTPSLASGTAGFGVDIAVPPGIAGFAPKIALEYDSGGGNSDLGIGWQFGGLPEIRLRTEDGLPKFAGSDPVEIVGMGVSCDLIEISAGVFRPRYESGVFVRVQRASDRASWEARDKAGTTFRFGGDGFTEREGDRIVTWLLREQRDLYGHAITYSWKTDNGHARIERIVYNDFDPSVRNELLFTYEPRPDPSTRFSSGIREVLSERLQTIDVRHGGSLVRRYAATYTPGLHSRIASVTMLGRDGVTSLPTLSLEYTAPKLATGASLVTMKAPPGRSPSDANVDVADLDGDGLPDLLVTKAGAFRSYQNLDGVSWGPGLDWLPSASPSVELATIGVQLADADGDGAVDLLVKSGLSSFRYFPGKALTEFAAPKAIARAPNFTFEDADVRVADMDGDRRADVVITTPSGIAIAYNLNGTDWTEPAFVGEVDPKQPLRFSDGKTQLCDVNGDRVQDFCYLRSGSLVYWLGRGRGRFELAKTATGVPTFDETSLWQLTDLDGDGWVDLLHVGVTQIEFALASAEGTFGAQQTLTGVPTKSSTTFVRLADMNGNGTNDIVWIDVSGSPDQAWKYLELFPDGRGGLLRRIENGLGKVVSVTYGTAAAEAAAARAAGTPWSSRINVATTVIKKLVLDASLGDPPMVTEYEYIDGTYSGGERTFIGFAAGREKSIGDEFTPTLITESKFDVGLTERTMRGAVLGVDTRSADGKLFQRLSSKYTRRVLAKGIDGREISYSLKTWEQTEHVEGGAGPSKITLTEWDHDDFGNVIREDRWGEVVGTDRLAGADESLITRTFANDPAEWILGRLASEEIRDGKGNRVTHRRLYYDGEPFNGLPLGKLTRGSMSREEAWVGPGDDAFELVVAARHDEHGNIVETRDGRGGGRAFTWHPVNHTVLVGEALVTGNGTLRQTAEYDAAFGNVIAMTEFNGSVSRFKFDVFGRVETVIKPGDSDERPTAHYVYKHGSPLSVVITEGRIWSGRDEVGRRYEYTDGLGRPRAGLVADDEGRWILSGVTVLDARGNSAKEVRPRFVTAAEAEKPPLTGEGVPADSFWRDALARSIRTRSHLGIETRTTFAPLSVNVWDGAQTDPKSPYEHTPATAIRDGLGRVVSVDRTLGGKILSARFTYDAAGNLTSRRDPDGFLSSYTFDGKSRRIGIDDPDRGKWRFVYDAANNVIERHAPDGIVRRDTFDLLGRRLTEDWDGDGKPEVVRTFDEGDLGAGLLTAVVDAAGVTRFAYDARQRPVGTTYVFADREIKTASQYDAQDRKVLHTYPDGSSLAIRWSLRGTVAGFGKDAVTIANDADGREMRRTFNTGVTQLFGYDDDFRRTDDVVKAADGSVLQHLVWKLDGADNVMEVRDARQGVAAANDRSETYSYDNLYRLTAARGSWGESTHAYSASGSFLRRTGTVPALEAEIALSTTSHAMTRFKGRSLSYDERGRMRTDGDRTFSWNAADQLVKVVAASGATVDNTFDHDGLRRIRRERLANGEQHTTIFIDQWTDLRDGKYERYIVHGGRRIVRLSERNGAPQANAEPPGCWSSARTPNSDGSLVGIGIVLLAILTRRSRAAKRTFVRSAIRGLMVVLLAGGVLLACKSDEDEPPRPPEGTVLSLSDEDDLLFADAINSVTDTTTGTGKPKATFAAFPFGATRVDTSSETHKFANAPRDASVGIDIMGVRAYAPDLGVWLSPDPLGVADPEEGMGGDFAAWHPYAYASDRPVTYVDPDGRSPVLAAAPQIALGAAAFIAAYSLVNREQMAKDVTTVTSNVKSFGQEMASGSSSSTTWNSAGIAAAPAAGVISWNGKPPPIVQTLPKVTAGNMNGWPKLERHHTIPVALMKQMMSAKHGGLLDASTFKSLESCDNRAGCLQVTKFMHRVIHVGLSLYLMHQYPELKGLMPQNFQGQAAWDKYLTALENRGFKGAALKKQVLTDLYHYYRAIPMVWNGRDGVDFPPLRFGIDAAAIVKSPITGGVPGK